MTATSWIVLGVSACLFLFILERLYYLIRWPGFCRAGCKRVRIKTKTASLKGWNTADDDLFWSTDFDVAFQFKKVGEKEWEWLRVNKSLDQFLVAARKAKAFRRDPEGYMAPHPPKEEDLLEWLQEIEADLERLSAKGERGAEYEIMLDQKMEILRDLQEVRKQKRKSEDEVRRS
jgi:hypothetical protein